LAAQTTTNNHRAILLNIPTLLAVKAAMRHEMDKIAEVVGVAAEYGEEIHTDWIRLICSQRIRKQLKKEIRRQYKMIL
jgi:hypothetical protein